MFHLSKAIVPSALLAALTLAACTNSARDSTSTVSVTPTVIAGTSGLILLKDEKGDVKGKAAIQVEEDKAIQVSVELEDLPAGYYPVDVYSVGACLPDVDPAKNFSSAGAIYAKPASDKGVVAGALDLVKVGADGKGKAIIVTRSFTLADLNAGTGTSIIVHLAQSNLPPQISAANQASNPSEAIKSPSRLLCGVISAGSSK